MSGCVIRGPSVIGYHRRKSTRNLDLNSEPPSDNCDQGEPSSQMEAQAALNRLQRNSLPPTTMDVEIIDDDIVESSARAFAEAKNKSRRNARTVVDLDLEDQTRISANYHNKRRRGSQNHMIINCDLYINLEGSNSSTCLGIGRDGGRLICFRLHQLNPPHHLVVQTTVNEGVPSNNETVEEELRDDEEDAGFAMEKTVQSPSPRKEPVFNCPICIASFVEETSTKCGHIFCKACIKAAVSAQGKCPTCRKKVTMKELIRVYLPAMR